MRGAELLTLPRDWRFGRALQLAAIKVHAAPRMSFKARSAAHIRSPAAARTGALPAAGRLAAREERTKEDATVVRLRTGEHSDEEEGHERARIYPDGKSNKSGKCRVAASATIRIAVKRTVKKHPNGDSPKSQAHTLLA